MVGFGKVGIRGIDGIMGFDNNAKGGSVGFGRVGIIKLVGFGSVGIVRIGVIVGFHNISDDSKGGTVLTLAKWVWSVWALGDLG